MRYEQFRESFEKYPPSWGDDEYGEDEMEEEQDNKRCRSQNSLTSSSRRP